MPTPNADHLRTVVRLANDRRWVAIQTKEDGMLASAMTETAVGHYVAHELRDDGGMEHGRAYYGLLDPATPGRMSVVLVTGGPGEPGDSDGPQVVGFRNADPYPSFGTEIEALAKEVGHSLPHECYTMRGRGDGGEFKVRLDGPSLRRAKRIEDATGKSLSSVLGMLVTEALAARDAAPKG